MVIYFPSWVQKILFIVLYITIKNLKNSSLIGFSRVYVIVVSAAIWWSISAMVLWCVLPSMISVVLRDKLYFACIIKFDQLSISWIFCEEFQHKEEVFSWGSVFGEIFVYKFVFIVMFLYKNPIFLNSCCNKMIFLWFFFKSYCY